MHSFNLISLLAVTLISFCIVSGYSSNPVLQSSQIHYDENDLHHLLDGVSTIKLDGEHGQIAVFGESAFPLIIGDSGSYDLPLAAGGHYGSGRIVAIARVSTPSLFQINFDNSDGSQGENFNSKFYNNLYSWLGANATNPKIALIGSDYPSDYQTFLSSINHEVTLIAEADFENVDPPSLTLFSVVVINYNFPLHKVDTLLSFVEQGGGLLIAPDHWNILETRPEFEDPSFYTHEFAPSRVTAEAGFVFSGEYYQEVYAPEGDNNFTVSIDAMQTLHFQDFWPLYEAGLTSGNFEDFPTAQHLQLMLIIFSYMPQHIADVYFTNSYENIKTFVSTPAFHSNFSDGSPVANNADRVKLLLFHYVSMLVLKNEDIQVHPGVQFFPNFEYGWPPSSFPHNSGKKQVEENHECVQRKQRSRLEGRQFRRRWTNNGVGFAENEFPGSSIHTDNYRRRWFNTGFYAEPGKTVRLTLNSDTILVGFGIQIGVHTDRWNFEGNSRFERIPTLYMREYIENNYVELASPYGGLVLVQVPYEAYSLYEVGQGPNITVEGEGVVMAPIFEYGKTVLTEWQQTIRYYPGLWTEFKTPEISYVFPTSLARQVENPDECLSLWGHIMYSFHDFTGTPRTNGEWRRDFIIMDYSSYAGAAHAGYPTVVPKEWKDDFINTSRMRNNDDSWGMLHEIGHDYQEWSWWAIDGTSETTNNVLVLYIQETLFGHDAAVKMEQQELQQNIQIHIDNGRLYDEWKSDPWLALGTYYQLKLVYGWGAFKTVFEKYRTFTQLDLPLTSEDQTDLWIVTFSLAVNENLAPLFESWGVPLSSNGLSQIQHLRESMARMDNLLS